MNERIKELRKNILKMTQSEFAQRISVSDATISKIEKGTSVLTERNIKAICKEFNVSIAWLKEGIGDVFVDSDEALLTELTNTYNLSNQEIELLRKFLQLTNEEREYLLNTLDKLLK